MSSDEPLPEEQYTALFAAGEEALVTGQTGNFAPVPADLQGRLEGTWRVRGCCARCCDDPLRDQTPPPRRPACPGLI